MVTAHALTVHKAQGSTIDMTGDMDRTTKTGSRSIRIYPGQFFTLLSRARSGNAVRILNFDETNTVFSDLIKAKMERLRRDSVFTWRHPILQNERMKMCLLNIVSWNLHIHHLLPDKYYMN